MSLKAVVTKEEHSGLSDGIKKEYVEKDGMFILDVTPVTTENGRQFALDDVTGLKSALGKERQSVATLKETLAKFGDVTPENVTSIRQELEVLKSGSSDEKVKAKIDSAIKQVTEKYTKELEGKDGQLKTMMGQVEELLVNNEAAKVLSEQDTKGSVTLLLPHIKSRVKVVQQDGKHVVQVIGADGAPRISPASGSNAPMTIAELVKEMKQDNTYAPAFAGSGQSGGGGVNQGGPKGKPYILSAADSKDPAKYRQAKAEAEKAHVELQIQG